MRTSCKRTTGRTSLGKLVLLAACKTDAQDFTAMIKVCVKLGICATVPTATAMFPGALTCLLHVTLVPSFTAVHGNSCCVCSMLNLYVLPML